MLIFFFQAEDGIRDFHVTGVQTCALPISCAFSASLTTTVFSQRSTRWFGASPRRATPKGLPSSLAQHRIKESRLHQPPLCVRDTRGCRKLSSLPERSGRGREWLGL